uniref:ELM2 domain-containing protein n=1 Tax=Caenorhabditis tropicalis TaxID=1561998 RepID=A0A1I7SXK9_9PELO
MENCETSDREVKIWVPEELAKATGEMFKRFEIQKEKEEEEPVEEVEEVIEEEEEYNELIADESSDPYVSSADSSITVDDLEEED